jgi:prevent-host-death family protein
MKTVSIKQLQNDLGRYLDEVRAGEEVVIEERNNPVAKIIPFGVNGEIDSLDAKQPVKKKARAPFPPLEEDPLYMTNEELDAHEASLIAEGKMRPPIAPLPPEFWEEPLADFGDVDVVRFISEDRDED